MSQSRQETAVEPLIRSMSGQLTARIRERILNGAYAPGAPLLQDSIAAEFGVSKIPVREALVQLRSEGLIDIFTHRGFQVRAVSVEEMLEVFRLRLQIEPAAVELGSRKAMDADRIAVRHALDALNTALRSTALRTSGDLNTAFHLALIVPHLQPVTAEVLYRLHTLSQRYVRLHLHRAGRADRAISEHEALLETWRDGKARDARRLMREHIEAISQDLSAALSGRQRRERASDEL